MLGDGGIETSLDEDLGQNLEDFSAFPLLETPSGRQALREYYAPYLQFAEQARVPFILDTPTWRANPDWGEKLGYSADALAQINREAVTYIRALVDEIAPHADITVNGCVGPRYDDYDESERMTVAEAMKYHLPQVQSFQAAGADRVTSVTTLDVAEGAGVVLAAMYVGVPSAVSFFVTPDGRLADRTTLENAIGEVDQLTQESAIGYLVNCAHPSEVLEALQSARVQERLFGLRLNAAREDDSGPRDEPAEFANQMARVLETVPHVTLLGGCCGTNFQHIRAMADRTITR